MTDALTVLLGLAAASGAGLAAPFSDPEACYQTS
jgi:hypothetical protein